MMKFEEMYLDIYIFGIEIFYFLKFLKIFEDRGFDYLKILDQLITGTSERFIINYLPKRFTRSYSSLILKET